MKKQDRLASLIKYLRAIGILTVINLAAVGLICLIGWRTWLDYSNGLMYSAGLFLSVGGLSLIGKKKSKGGIRPRRLSTIDDMDIEEVEDSEDNESTNKNVRFFIIMEITGMLSIAASILVGVSAGL